MVQEEARQTMEPLGRVYRTLQAPTALEVRVDPLEAEILDTIEKWNGGE